MIENDPVVRAGCSYRRSRLLTPARADSRCIWSLASTRNRAIASEGGRTWTAAEVRSDKPGRAERERGAPRARSGQGSDLALFELGREHEYRAVERAVGGNARRTTPHATATTHDRVVSAGASARPAAAPSRKLNAWLTGDVGEVTRSSTASRNRGGRVRLARYSEPRQGRRARSRCAAAAGNPATTRGPSLRRASSRRADVNPNSSPPVSHELRTTR
jgi:hypothetical protein